MSYRVREIFWSLCGEGTHVGRSAVFCRFSGCNLWTGREVDRATATCQFCDTDFVGGETYASATDLAMAIESVYPFDPLAVSGYIVLTGGEPALQMDRPLLLRLRSRGFTVAVESNGTVPLKDQPDWITVSPKSGTKLVVTSGDELKLAFPQVGVDPSEYAGLDFGLFYLQPIDGTDLEANTRAAIDYCLRHPKWRLSEQRHKQWGLR